MSLLLSTSIIDLVRFLENAGRTGPEIRGCRVSVSQYSVVSTGQRTTVSNLARSRTDNPMAAMLLARTDR